MPQRTCGVSGCAKPHRARGLCSSHYNQQHQPDRHRKSTVACTVCGEPTLKAKRARHKPVCSMYCRWFLQNPVLSCPIPRTHPAHPRWAEPGHLLPVVWSPPVPRPERSRPRRVWVAGRCRHCTAPFVDRQPEARFCSTRCGRKYWRDERKNEVPHAIRLHVLERDGWRCQICRRGIPATLSVPHPKAGTVDHVVPRSQGGNHDPANLRAAHFECNWRRGNRGGGEQLALIG
jgi:5-methylcytosine-specific restriction endonuclease McrA